MTPAVDREALRRQWQADGTWTSATLATLIRRGGRRHGRTALTFHTHRGVQRSTVGAMTDMAERLASSLSSCGLRAGDAVVAQLPNCVEGVTLLYASMLMGLIYVPVIHIYGSTELGHILADMQASALVVPRRLRATDVAERVGAIDPGVVPETVICVGAEPEDVPDGWTRWESLMAGGAPVQTGSRSGDDIAVVIYTSGTTSAPKGVAHSHNGVRWEVTSTVGRLGWTEGAQLLNPSPAGHMTAVLSALRPVAAGLPTTYMDVWDPELALQLIEGRGIEAMTATAPYFVDTLLERSTGTSVLRDHPIQVVTGGAAVPPSLMEAAEDAGMIPFRSYGSSEHPTITTGDARDRAAHRLRSDGSACPAVHLRIVDHNGVDLPRGEQGEILSIGPEQYVGYVGRAAPDPPFRPDGWLATGDLGVMDGEGYLTVTGRKKDIIIRGGENLSVVEIEDVVQRHPAVRDVAVVAYADPRYGERVCAFVVVREGFVVDLPDLGRHFRRSGVAVQKTPERLEIIASLPRTATGKIHKSALRERLAAGE